MKTILLLLLLAMGTLSAQSSSDTTPAVTYQVTSDWGTGRTANVTITNHTSTAIDSWTVRCSYPSPITSIWDAVLVAHVGNVYTIASKAYTASIPVGGSVTFGFNATGAAAALTDCLVNGSSPSSGGTSGPGPVSTAAPVVTYAVTQNWGTGLQAMFTLANPNSTAIANWTLAFNLPYSIASIWDGKIISRIGNVYTVTDAGWNASIPAGGSVSFSFIAAISGTLTGPTTCSVNGLPVSSATCPLISSTADTTPPTVPANVNWTVQSTSSILLQWNASSDSGSGVAGYSIWKNDANVATVAGTQYTATGLAPNVSYSFAVRAIDNAGNTSGPSSTVTVKVPGAATCGTLPAAPGNPAVMNGTSSTIQVGWSAPAAQPNCTVTYTLYQGTTMVASGVKDTSYQFSALQPSTAYTFGIVAVNEAGSSTVAYVNAVTKDAVPTAPSVWPSSVFAPYVDMTTWPTPNLTSTASASGQKYFTMAFIVSQGTCQAAFGGILLISSSIIDDINKLRKAGGDVVVSFGGATGTELAQSCTSVMALRDQYQQVIDRTGATRIDFDIEGGAITDQASISRRNQAIAALQGAAKAKGKSLIVQYTLPVEPTGLTSDGLAVLNNAKQYGVDVSVVNIMAMDYGAAFTSSSMGNYAIQAAASVNSQLKTIYSGISDAQRWKMLGVTPMIGMNDVAGEIFAQQDARKLEDWATGHSIGLLSMWSMGRDMSCPGNGAYVAANCSGIVQVPYEFTSTFKPFTH